jgi:CRISPR system Cascade subunit CasC
MEMEKNEMEKYDYLNGTKMAEIHILKLYPSSALNRDDVGEQKTAYYNGVLRNRISSQCIKRAYRLSDTFADQFEKIGTRTRRMPEYVTEKLSETISLTEEEKNRFKIILSGQRAEGGKKTKAEENIENGKPVNTLAIAFYSQDELDKIIDICSQIYNELAEPKINQLKKIGAADIQKRMSKFVHPITVDVASFGRMVTDNMLRPVNGAVYVSQVLSTNAAIKESDYFIACDDFVTGDTAEDNGGAMLGDIDYASACYYFHSVIDLEQLAENLKNSENTEDIVKSFPAKFTEVMAYTDPSARQNTFEAHVLPEVIYVELKNKKRPLNRMKAFAEPSNRDVLRTSVNKLAYNIDLTNKKADLGITNAVWYCEDEGKNFKSPENVTVAQSISEVLNILNKWMDAE